MNVENNENIKIEKNFIISDKDTLIAKIDETALSQQANHLVSPPDEKTKQQLEEHLERLLLDASRLKGNQSGSPVNMLGKHNIQLHKFCWGIIKTGYALLPYFAAQGQQLFPFDKVAVGLADMYGAIEKTDQIEWLIIDTIQSFAFKNAGRILIAPGPTLEEIKNQLGDGVKQIGDIKSLLDKMIEKDILEILFPDDPLYYQVKYLSQYLHPDS